MEPAKEIFLESVRNICPSIADDELSRFVLKLTTKDLAKKDYFIQSGKIQNAIGFISSGLVRSYYIDPEGNEITVGFYAEGEYATHYPSFLTQSPSHYFIQCLEATTMVCLSFDDMQEIYKHSPGFERYGRLVAEKILVRQQSRIETFIFQTAEQRYINFIKQHPTLFNRISVSHLCSSLGIERQTLTRIRHKLAHRNI